MKKFAFLKIVLCAAAFGAVLPAAAQVAPVVKGRAAGRIVVTTSELADLTAATLLQDFLCRISGAELPVVSADELAKAPRRGDVLIGNGLSNASLVTDALSEDGFRIATGDGLLRIVSGGDKGSVYGVVTLLERYLGVEYWGEYEYSLTHMDDIRLPKIDLAENPAFRYRQSQFYGLATDPVYRLWMRLEEPQDMFAAGYWVHTFSKLLPVSLYGKSHPEYYAYYDGKRHPGSQWCLTNPEVFEIVAARIDSIFKANPGRNMISVSQNDGNHTYCRCDACRAIDEREEAFSGSLVYFLNKLADRFPDKEFSTLSYLYSMKSPKHIVPRPNVNIMLCDIDCEREVSLTENASGREFVAAIKGWSERSRNIFVWDYGINFDNYLAPFPNFHILADNIRLFRDHGANMHFSQVAGSRGGDFAEMRTWLVSKLMWNPDLDTDELMKRFLEGYYGAAAPYLYKYTQIMEGALLGSGKRLWIYDSPVSHKEGMLRPALMRRYAELFDRAEAAVADDSVRLARVQRTRLPLLYSELELARTDKEKDLDALTRKLDYFEQQVKLYRVPTLNERSNSPVDYCTLFRQRYMPRAERSLARDASVRFETEPTGRYAELGRTALTDELFGGSSFVESWVGWEGVDASFVIDLGEEKEVHSIEADFLHQLGQWILLPRRVAYEVSTDGKHFTEAGAYDLAEDRSVQVKFVGVKHEFASSERVRYIRVSVTGTKTCPHWHYGVGHACWFFIDEVTVL